MASKDKQPVGFATHIIAGGTAGMAEAVSLSRLLHRRVFTAGVAMLPAIGYHQGQDAIVQVG
jgi:nitrate reductase gamma subunit